MNETDPSSDHGPGLYKAPKRKFEETIVLVPFFQSVPQQLSAHISLLNKLGFDVFLVPLSFDFNWDVPPISSKMSFGLKHVWTDEIENALNSVAGPKIVFSFSNPSASAIAAIARRGAQDVKALICDSGPSKHAFKSILRLYTKNKPLFFLPLNLARSTLSSLMVSPTFSKELDEDLAKFPENYPILSIRGWRDNIIPSSYIDDVFEPHPHLSWQKLSLPEAEHLNGLRDFEEEYVPPVERFLLAHGTSL